MQESIIYKKSASFEELCPNWSDEIHDQNEFTSLQNHVFTGKDKVVRRLSNGSCCIVGEAHG